MTTAHRPTWKSAVGRENEGGWTAGGAASAQVSALDAPAHLTLKTRRADGGDKKAALKKSLLALQEAEKDGPTASSKQYKKNLLKRTMDPAIEERGQQRLLKQSAEVDVLKLKEQYDDADIDDDDGGGGGGESDGSSDLDKNDDDTDLDNDSNSNSSDDDDDDDNEDDEAALQAELAKIRTEREQARVKAEERAAKEESARQEESALLGNPLLATTTEGGLAGFTGKTKRRWNDDVVFRNQAKGEPSTKKRFINDTVRNDFHKRFLNKFIR